MAILTPEQLNGRKIVQVAFHVNNLERAALHWACNFGAGPFERYAHGRTSPPAVLGRRCALRAGAQCHRTDRKSVV